MVARAKMPSFKKRAGFHISETDAAAIGKALLALEQQHGRHPTAREIVEYARPKRSPIHHLFEWDIAEAAMKHWLATAGYIMRAVRIEFVKDGREWSVPGTRNIKVEYVDSGGEKEFRREYIPTNRVVLVNDHKAQAIQQLQDHLESAKAIYEQFQQYAGFEQFSGVMKEIKKLKPQRKERVLAATA